MTRHPRRVLAPGLVLLTLALGACGSGGGAGTTAGGSAAGTPDPRRTAASSPPGRSTPTPSSPAAGSTRTPSPVASTPAITTVEVSGLRSRDEVHLLVGQRLRVQPPLARDTGVTVEVTPVTVGASAAGVVARDAAAGALVYRATRAGSARLVVTSGPRCSPGRLCPSYRRLVGSVVVVVGA